MDKAKDDTEPGGGKGHERVQVKKGRCEEQGEVEKAAVKSHWPTPA